MGKSISEQKLQSPTACQLYDLPSLSMNRGLMDIFIFVVRRLKRFSKRRCAYLMRTLTDLGQPEANAASANISSTPVVFSPGELVRVKSRQEILSTLDRWNQLKGCSFMDEMWQYCDTEQLVFRKVVNFLDERDYSIRKCKGIYTLKDVTCSGTVDFGPCDRSCFFFWRHEWLENLPG